MPLLRAWGLILQHLLSTGERVLHAVPGAGTSWGGWFPSARPLRATSVTLPSPTSRDLPSPRHLHFAAPGCQVSTPCPVPDPAGVPAPSAFAILALLPRSQKLSYSFYLSLKFSLWKSHGCCAHFSSQACRSLGLRGLCPARIQRHREDQGFPLALTAAGYEKPGVLLPLHCSEARRYRSLPLPD